jgi:hypothetical protein
LSWFLRWDVLEEEDGLQEMKEMGDTREWDWQRKNKKALK